MMPTRPVRLLIFTTPSVQYTNSAWVIPAKWAATWVGASPYGALDMAGNVYEWVSDWYASDYYDTSPYANPLGPVDGIYKVKRGGSWGYFFHNLRTAFRAASYLDPNNNVGFRCAAP